MRTLALALSLTATAVLCAPSAAAPIASLAPAGVGGGSDDCATPDIISGTGTFAVNMAAATTSFVTPTCFFSTPAQDVWFQWTASASGMATVSLCPYSTFDDTMLAIWDEVGCPTGTTLACNDNGCPGTAVSRVSFVVTSGSVYTIQVGMFPKGGLGVNLFMDITINPIIPPPANDECANAIALAGPGTYAYDATAATTSAQQLSNCANIHKDLWYTYQATTTGMATISTCGTLAMGSDQDTRIAVYAGAGCPPGSDIACNDNSFLCPTITNSTLTWAVVCGSTYTIQLGQTNIGDDVLGNFTVSESGACTPVPPEAFCFGDGINMSCPCNNSGAATNGCANSSNAMGANLAATGTFSITADTATLVGSGMPATSPALYFQGTEREVFGFGTPFGDGLRCAGGTMVRLGIKFSVAGSSSYPAGSPPISVQGGASVGDVRTYQALYRDADPAFCPTETFNLTNGIEATWTP